MKRCDSEWRALRDANETALGMTRKAEGMGRLLLELRERGLLPDDLDDRANKFLEDLDL